MKIIYLKQKQKKEGSRKAAWKRKLLVNIEKVLISSEAGKLLIIDYANELFNNEINLLP